MLRARNGGARAIFGRVREKLVLSRFRRPCGSVGWPRMART